jgi:cell wall-associated NlpC family hydrolase
LRFPLRATALALTAVTLLGAGTVAASVTAAAYEVDVSAQAVAPAVDPIAAAAPLTTEAKAALLTAAREQHAREIALATARAAVKAKQARIERIRARIITVAKNQIGDRYSAGATGPSAFDCSGFTRFVYKVAAGKELPHYSRAQYTKVKKIPLKQARPGDLVFFLRNGAHHVGIYLGKGRMVDAAGYGKGVKISPISGSWWSRTFTGIGRILPA